MALFMELKKKLDVLFEEEKKKFLAKSHSL